MQQGWVIVFPNRVEPYHHTVHAVFARKFQELPLAMCGYMLVMLQTIGSGCHSSDSSDSCCVQLCILSII